MAFQAGLLGCEVQSSQIAELSAEGAAFIAGLSSGFWQDEKELSSLYKAGRRYPPAMDKEKAAALYAGWQKALSMVLR